MTRPALAEFAGPVMSVSDMWRAMVAQRSDVPAPRPVLRRRARPPRRGLGLGLLGLGLRRTTGCAGGARPILGPRLVELHPPLALLVLLEGQPGAEVSPP